MPTCRCCANWRPRRCPACTSRWSRRRPIWSIRAWCPGLVARALSGRGMPDSARAAGPARPASSSSSARRSGSTRPTRTVSIARRGGRLEARGYDVASLDVGGVMDARGDRRRGRARALRAADRRVSRCARGAPARQRGARSRPRRCGDGDGARRCATRRAPPDDLVVIGGGAGGVELALALRARRGPIARVALVCGGPLLAAHSAALQRRVRRALVERGIAVHEATVPRDRGRSRSLLDNGTHLACDLAIVATGSAAPAWLRPSGLALDADGFVATGPTLQSLSHPEVFAAGDVATRADAKRPRNGVHAVRAGPPLARNLRLFLEGRPCRPYRPQRHSLALIACGDGSAIAEWHGWSLEGRGDRPLEGPHRPRVRRRSIARLELDLHHRRHPPVGVARQASRSCRSRAAPRRPRRRCRCCGQLAARDRAVGCAAHLDGRRADCR